MTDFDVLLEATWSKGHFCIPIVISYFEPSDVILLLTMSKCAIPHSLDFTGSMTFKNCFKH